MSENKKSCPEFPYWGASYPDACCVDGKLQDLDHCDKNGIELAFEERPERKEDFWTVEECFGIYTDCVGLPPGSVKKLTGQELTWEDEPIELE